MSNLIRLTKKIVLACNAEYFGIPIQFSEHMSASTEGRRWLMQRCLSEFSEQLHLIVANEGLCVLFETLLDKLSAEDPLILFGGYHFKSELKCIIDKRTISQIHQTLGRDAYYWLLSLPSDSNASYRGSTIPSSKPEFQNIGFQLLKQWWIASDFVGSSVLDCLAPQPLSEFDLKFETTELEQFPTILQQILEQQEKAA